MDYSNLQQYPFNIKLSNVSVYSRKDSLEHAHKEIELIYLIKGKLQVEVNKKKIDMKSSDFLVINSNEFHSFHSLNDNLFVSIFIDYSLIHFLLAQNSIIFSCNSIENPSDNDRKLRKILNELLTSYIKQGNGLQAEFLEKFFKLISYLTLNYLRNDYSVITTNLTHKEKNERLTEILIYIHNNYSEPLTLAEVADLHFISVPYLSKFFKQHTGRTFSKYLNEIRLAHAVNELVNTDKPITRIALDNGFPNLAAFNRVFHENYQIKPVEYRKKNKVTNIERSTSQEEVSVNNSEALTALQKYFSIKDAYESNVHENVITVNVPNDENVNTLSKNWNKLINIGYATDILNSDMQEQLVLLQNEIGFTYARFWGIFNDDMQVEDQSDGNLTYNFTKISKLIDFLIKNKLKPFFELGPKPKVISKKVDQTFVINENIERSIDEWKNLIKAFLVYCVERYGIEEVETWYFELWRKPIFSFYTRIEDESNFLNEFRKNDDEQKNYKNYFNLFAEFKKVIKEIVPSAKVGGCGLSMDLEGDYLEILLTKWRDEVIKPDFLSIYMYPLELDYDKKGIPIKNMQSSNPHFMRDKLQFVKQSMGKTGFDDLELNITEWNISISNRDYLNDSCFKATYIVKNIIENCNGNHVNMIGYWLFSDIFSEFRDSKNLLHGGAGLITKSGIKKPSYHAFTLLNQLGDQLVAKGENYIFTKKSGDRYQILCYNYKHFDYSYYLRPEGSFAINEQYDIFDNNDDLNYKLEISGITNGKYRVKEIRLNRTSGSVFDEWLNFGALEEMNQDEVNYLKQICIPHMKVWNTEVRNMSMILNIELEPHEVRLFDIHFVLKEK